MLGPLQEIDLLCFAYRTQSLARKRPLNLCIWGGRLREVWLYFSFAPLDPKKDATLSDVIFFFCDFIRIDFFHAYCTGFSESKNLMRRQLAVSEIALIRLKRSRLKKKPVINCYVTGV